jgi:hypothetical protein
MPFDRDQMRVYMSDRRAKRKQDIIEILGGECTSCQSRSDLEIDHIDKSSKLFQLSGRGLDKNWQLILKEIKKCQLLCSSCHMHKNKSELSVEHGEGKSGKRRCSCEPCKLRKKEYMKTYTKKWR